MSSLLRELQELVHGYWIGATVREDENPKQALVRETCVLAKHKGLTEAEIDEWARYQQGQLTVAVVSAKALQELRTRLNQPGGAERFRKRLERERRKREARR